MGTAGSVRLALGELDETFLVISGDALCDFDLTAIVDFHRERGAAVTIGLKSVDNPLEFGIVVTDERGPRRALPREAVLGPGLLGHDQHRGLRDRAGGAAATSRPTAPTTSRRSSSRCCSRWAGRSTATSATATGRTSATSTSTGRRTSTPWTRLVQLEIPGMRLRGNIWIGEGVEMEDLETIEGPAFIGNYCAHRADAEVGPYTVLGASVTLRERARTARSVIDASTHIGAPARSRARSSAGRAISVRTCASTRASRSATR